MSDRKNSWGDRLRKLVSGGLGLRRGRSDESGEHGQTTASSTGTPSNSATRKRARPRRRNQSLPKRPGNAFSYYVKSQARKMTAFSPENMKVLADKWKNLPPSRKEQYERQAAHDARRYQFELAQNKEVKPRRPCSGYMLFVSDFVKHNGRDFGTVQHAVSAGARRWNEMATDEKTKWLAMGRVASEQYASRKLQLDKKQAKVARAAAALAPKTRAVVRTKIAAKTKALSKAKVKPAPRGKLAAAKVKAKPRAPSVVRTKAKAVTKAKVLARKKPAARAKLVTAKKVMRPIAVKKVAAGRKPSAVKKAAMTIRKKSLKTAKNTRKLR